jgi:Lon protease-like protein
MAEQLSDFSLPLFPLGTVLFPGGLLPLQIFEVRYLDMINKCHRSSSPFGVVTLTQGTEVQKPADGDSPREPFSAESFMPEGTLAIIDEFSTPQPGLIRIRCTGTTRFRLASFDRLGTGLWFGSATPLPADLPVEVPADLRNVATALEKLMARLRAQNVPADQMPFHEPYRLDDCSWVANRWCELIPMPIAQKNRLMALDNPLLRLELVSDMLSRGGMLE